MNHALSFVSFDMIEPGSVSGRYWILLYMIALKFKFRLKTYVFNTNTMHNYVKKINKIRKKKKKTENL